jgi:heat shock protein HtpX
MTGNSLRTFMLLAIMTGLFMAIGFLVGGPGGAMLRLCHRRGA